MKLKNNLVLVAKQARLEVNKTSGVFMWQMNSLFPHYSLMSRTIKIFSQSFQENGKYYVYENIKYFSLNQQLL